MATHYDGTPNERRALDAYIKLMRSTAAINSRLFPQLQASFGITPSQLGVLEALLHLGPMPHCALAAKLLVSASNLTTVIDNLERDGLVRRDRDPDDRRVSITSLTPAGEARLAGRRQRGDGDSTIVWITVAPDQPISFEIVDDGGEIAGADEQLGRQSAVRHRPQMKQRLEHAQLAWRDSE